MSALRDPDTTNVFFVLLKYEWEKEDAKRVKMLDVNLQEEGTISWQETNPRLCKLPGFQKHTHLACELDDVLLTKFHSELLKQAKAVKVVSGDRNVLKMPGEVKKVEDGVKNKPDLKPSLTLVKVPVEVPA